MSLPRMTPNPLGMDRSDDVQELDYERNTLQRYRTLIRDRVGQERPTIPELKNVKIQAPSKYHGDDDIEKFETWLTALLRWFRVNGMCGPERDALRIDLSGTTLDGLAAEWFTTEVEAYDRKVNEWLFEDLVCAMYKRFIHEVTAQNATDKFNTARYSKAKGALAYFNDLKRYSSRMIQPPDEYTFKRKFTDGLPSDLFENLVKSRRISAEHTPLEKLLAEVKAMESSLQAVEHRRSHATTSRQTTTTSTSANPTARQPRVVRFRRNTFGNEEKRASNRSGKDRRYSGNKDRGSSSHKQRSFSRSDSRRNGERREHNHAHSKGNTKGGSRDLSTVTCFKCGELGHYAPDCPKDEGKPRIFAAQVIHEDDETEKSESSAQNEQNGENNNEDRAGSQSDHESDPEGSQHTSSDAGRSLDEYEEWLEVIEDDSNSEPGEVAYIRSGHEVEESDSGESFLTASEKWMYVDEWTLEDELQGKLERSWDSDELLQYPEGTVMMDLLQGLPIRRQMAIWIMRKREDDPSWIISSTEYRKRVDENTKVFPPEHTEDEAELDAEWLLAMNQTEPTRFESYTGFTRIIIDCLRCGSKTHIIEKCYEFDYKIHDEWLNRWERVPGSREYVVPHTNGTEKATPGMEDTRRLFGVLTTHQRREIYSTRKRAYELEWEPNGPVPSSVHWWQPPAGIADLGYEYHDEERDIQFLWDLSWEDTSKYKVLTGRDPPARQNCLSCERCRPIRGCTLIRKPGYGEYPVYTYQCLVTGARFPSTIPNGPSIYAMAETNQPARVYRASMRKPVGEMSRPKRDVRRQQCLAAYIELNGNKAYALFDSGSTTDSVTPDFTRVADLPVYTLKDPVTLQLGCVGSRSKINYGVQVRTKFATIQDDSYFDVANLDKYDVILGTPFLVRHHIRLDFSNQDIILGDGTVIHGLPEGEGTATATPKFQNKSK